MNEIGRKPAQTLAKLASARQPPAPENWPTIMERAVEGKAGLREFGCGVAGRHVRHCCRNRGGLLRKQKLDASAMLHRKQQTTGPRGVRSYTAHPR